MATPREEINTLIDGARKAAVHMLRGGKGFSPFSLVMAPDGTVRLLRTIPGDPQGPPSPIEEEIAYARHVLRQMAEKQEIKAVAFLGMGQARFTGQEASVNVVIVEIEHEAEEPATLYFPFEWQPEGVADLKKPTARRHEPRIFPRTPPTGPAT
jgi:hypothetical protein